MIELDCLGDICPVPAMKLERALKDCRGGQDILLVTDHSCVFDSIRAICRKQRLDYVADEVMTGVWEVSISPQKDGPQQKVSETICEK